MESPQAFVPIDRYYALAGKRALSDHPHGAALFADISGFTPLTELLATRLGPMRGAEAMAQQLNRVYGALSLSRALTHQGYNSLALNDLDDAQKSFVEVIRLTREGGYLPYVLDSMVGLATLRAKDSDDEHALELVHRALQHPAIPHDAKSRAERLRSELETRLTPQHIQAAQARVRTVGFDQIVSQILNQPA